MELGTLFTLKADDNKIIKPIYRVENSHSPGCEDCAGWNNKPLCRRLPYCYSEQKTPQLKFVRLNSNAAKHAIKQKTTINQYPL